jgi:hypothetical protein
MRFLEASERHINDAILEIGLCQLCGLFVWGPPYTPRPQHDSSMYSGSSTIQVEVKQLPQSKMNLSTCHLIPRVSQIVCQLPKKKQT